MPRWKEQHYARAADFARELAVALGRDAVSSEPAGAPVAPPVSPSPAAKPAAGPGPTAASVFTAIPWKK